MNTTPLPISSKRSLLLLLSLFCVWKISDCFSASLNFDRQHTVADVSRIPRPAAEVLSVMEGESDWEKSLPKSTYFHDPNDQRYSASDWLHNIKSLPRSSILREIRRPVLTIMSWSTLVSIVHFMLEKHGAEKLAARLCMSSKPHSLLVSALGLLLVFRTNSAYQRFAEGRQIWERILAVSRNMSRLAVLYQADLGSSRKNRVMRLLAAFPYLLRHHIQPQCLVAPTLNEIVGTPHALRLLDKTQTPITGSRAGARHKIQSKGGVQECWVDRRSSPWCLLPDVALQKCISSSNRPLWVCDRLAQELTDVAYSTKFTSRERLTFLGQVDRLSQYIGECERIHQTAVPLNYARHSLRSLTLWLFTLPFGILGDLGLLTGPVMGAIAWLLLGVYQIGYTIEDPFQGSLRLSSLCDAIYRDVMIDGGSYGHHRSSAFSSEALEEENYEWRKLDGVEGESLTYSWP